MKQHKIEKVLDLTGHRKKRGWWLAAILIVLLAVTGGFFWHSAQGEKPVQYTTRPVVRGDLTITVTATGALEPTNQVDVGVEISGTVETVAVDYNDHVKTGQMLAQLDTAKPMAQVLETKAALAAAHALVARSRADVKQSLAKLLLFREARKTSGGKVPSRLEMIIAEAALAQAEADEESARADVSRAEAELDFNQTNLSKATIRSPIDGIVLSRLVEPGQTVAASLQTPVLFTIAGDLAGMELRVDVDEADIGRVKAGQQASFTVDAYPERQFAAKVEEVRLSPKTIQGVVTYETVLVVANRDYALMPGMTATAEIKVKEVKDALLIPNASLRFTPPVQKSAVKKRRGFLAALLPHRKHATDQRKKYISSGKKRQVWLLTDQGPQAVLITTGESDGRMTEMISGDISAGQQIIIGTAVLDER